MLEWGIRVILFDWELFPHNLDIVLEHKLHTLGDKFLENIKKNRIILFEAFPFDTCSAIERETDHVRPSLCNSWILSMTPWVDVSLWLGYVVIESRRCIRRATFSRDSSSSSNGEDGSSSPITGRRTGVRVVSAKPPNG
jgi:hypothetical protein